MSIHPEQPPEQLPTRAPLNIALVIDRAGSMSGQPLTEAKRCAEFVVEGLTPADKASLVVYDDSVQTLVPTTSLADRETFRRAIRAVQEGGCTDLHGGWLRGAETLAAFTTAESVSRVMWSAQRLHPFRTWEWKSEPAPLSGRI